MEREDIKEVVRKWWEIYEDDTLDYKKSLKDHDQEKKEKPSQEALLTAMREAGLVPIRAAPRAA